MGQMGHGAGRVATHLTPTHNEKSRSGQTQNARPLEPEFSYLMKSKTC